MKNTKKLTRDQVIELFGRAYGYNIKGIRGVRVKMIDHHGNPLAPERYCYKLSFTIDGMNQKFAFWPETVGLQWCK